MIREGGRMKREGGRVIREESRRVGEKGWKIGEDCRRMTNFRIVTKGWAGSPTWLAQRERDRDGGDKRSREGVNIRARQRIGGC